MAFCFGAGWQGVFFLRSLGLVVAAIFQAVHLGA
jgi:hypothetical protein